METDRREVNKYIVEDLQKLLRGQDVMTERVNNLCGSIDKTDRENKDHHREFFTRIGSVETRLGIMEHIDDPKVLVQSSYQKVLLDLMKIIIPVGLTVLLALKIAGKI